MASYWYIGKRRSSGPGQVHVGLVDVMDQALISNGWPSMRPLPDAERAMTVLHYV